MSEKPDFCILCPINEFTEGYVPLKLGASDDLGVGEAAGGNESREGLPFCGGAGVWLDSLCRSAGMKKGDLNLINVIGCQPRGNVFPTSSDWTHTDRKTSLKAVVYCQKNHLEPALQGKRWLKGDEASDWELFQARTKPWKRIIALGDHALHALTGKRGIGNWRGSPLTSRLPLLGNPSPPHVMPTLHPAYLMRQANMFSIARRDLLKPMVLPPENYKLYPTLADVNAFHSPILAFDFEWDRDGNITLCGLTDRLYQAIVVPWQEPYINELRRIFETATDLIGQNIIMADWQHLEKMGWKITARLHDTMLKQHLIQPDMRHGLHFIASVFTNKVFWKGGGKEKDEEEEGNIAYEATGAQWRTWNDPLRGIPREQGGYFGCSSADEAFRLYNARDNDGTFQADIPIHQTLVKYGMESIYWNISVPVAHECRRMSSRGIQIDRTKIREVNEKLTTEITETELRLPEGLRPFGKSILRSCRLDVPIVIPKLKECRGTKKKAHENCGWTFEKEGEWECSRCGKRLRSGKLKVVKTEKIEEIKIVRPYASSQQLQVYARSIGCKDIKNRKTGRKTTGKSARKVWGREHIEFTLVDTLKKLSTLKNNFAKGKLLGYERIYFQLLPHGTSEGRLSCRGLRDGIDPNIQNQPKSIRGIYIPDYSDWGFIEADWSQGENWLTAFLARDIERLARLGASGYDEHSDLASRCFKIEVSKSVNKHLRDPGKVINHGKNYGMGVNHMQETLAMEGFNYSLADVKEMNAEWERLNEGTAKWQKETINRVKSQGYLENPFGRKRWFSSRDYATKGLAFTPASTLADMMLRVIIALNPRDYSQEISNLGIQVVANLPPQWFLAWTVHDSFILTGPWKYHREAAQQLKMVMEQKWNALDGFHLSCDITGSEISWGYMKALKEI